jgi:hypothetical protein
MLFTYTARWMWEVRMYFLLLLYSQFWNCIYSRPTKLSHDWRTGSAGERWSYCAQKTIEISVKVDVIKALRWRPCEDIFKLKISQVCTHHTSILCIIGLYDICKWIEISIVYLFKINCDEMYFDSIVLLIVLCVDARWIRWNGLIYESKTVFVFKAFKCRSARLRKHLPQEWTTGCKI